MSAKFPHLFSEIALGGCVVPNRIVSTGHHTYLSDVVPDERLIAYHEARAKGGAGLIISEVVAVHETAAFSKDLLKANGPDVVPAYAKLARACRRHDTRLFAQLFHPGREILSAHAGMMPVAWAPSAVPNERFHIMPKPMPETLIRDIIAGYAQTAGYLAEAGFDGFEIVASQGYLPSQFLNPRINLRNDAYGGNFDRRLRFLRDVVAGIRQTAAGCTLGMRISGAELDAEGLTDVEVLDVIKAIDDELDYVSVVAGTSASLGGSVHVVPAMGFEHAYTAPFAAAIKAATSLCRHRDRAYQPAADRRASHRRGPGRSVRYDAGDDLRPPNAVEGTQRTAGRHPRLHRLQSGVHRAGPQRSDHFLHPAPGVRARTRLRQTAAGRTSQEDSCGGWRTCGHEGRGHRGGARA